MVAPSLFIKTPTDRARSYHWDYGSLAERKFSITTPTYGHRRTSQLYGTYTGANEDRGFSRKHELHRVM